MRQRQRRLRHPLRLVSRVIVLRWAWSNRYDLQRWARFARRLPSEVRTRDLDDLVTEARARIAISADPRTRSAPDLDVVGFENGSLLVKAPGEKPIAQVARDVLAPVSGVLDVRVVDDRLPTPAASRPATPLSDNTEPSSEPSSSSA